MYRLYRSDKALWENTVTPCAEINKHLISKENYKIRVQWFFRLISEIIVHFAQVQKSML